MTLKALINGDSEALAVPDTDAWNDLLEAGYKPVEEEAAPAKTPEPAKTPPPTPKAPEPAKTPEPEKAPETNKTL